MGTDRETKNPGTFLPSSLREEIGVEKRRKRSKKRGSKKEIEGKQLGRRELRRGKRDEKKQSRVKAIRAWHVRRSGEEEQGKEQELEKVKTVADKAERQKEYKKDLRRRKRRKLANERKKGHGDAEDSSESETYIPPELVKDMQLDEDEAETRKLEKLLYRSSKRQQRKSKTFDWNAEFGSDDDDGLGYLLKGIMDIQSSKHTQKDKDDGDARAARGNNEDEDDESADSDDGDDDEQVEKDDYEQVEKDDDIDEEADEKPDEEADEEADEESDEEPDEEADDEDSKEELVVVEKYVSPAVRRRLERDGSGNVDTQAVEKRMRGLLNKLTDRNADKVAEEMYALVQDAQGRGITRNQVVSMFTERVLASIKDGSGVGSANPYIGAHVGVVVFLSVNYNDAVGAQILTQTIRRFNSSLLTKNRDSFGYLSFFAELYNVHFVHGSLIYELIHHLASELDEIRTELLLLLVRRVGASLRQDDPSALKDIVLFVRKLAEAGEGRERSDDDTERFRILLELFYDVKNNRISTRGEQGTAAPWLKDHIKRLTVLRVGLNNLLDDEFVAGRWWTAARLSNEASLVQHGEKREEEGKKTRSIKESTDVKTIAAQQKLNTDFRRAVFSAMMTSMDVADAYDRLISMDLRKFRATDVVRVLLQCCGKESSYNKFYALLARKLCLYRKEMSIAMQFALWDHFKELLAEEEGTGKVIPVRRLSNNARLLGFLLSTGALNLTVFKGAPDLTHSSGKVALFFRLALLESLRNGTENVDARGETPMLRSCRMLSKGEGFSEPDSIRLPLIIFIRLNFVNDPSTDQQIRQKAQSLLNVLEE